MNEDFKNVMKQVVDAQNVYNSFSNQRNSDQQIVDGLISAPFSSESSRGKKSKSANNQKSSVFSYQSMGNNIDSQRHEIHQDPQMEELKDNNQHIHVHQPDDLIQSKMSDIQKKIDETNARIMFNKDQFKKMKLLYGTSFSEEDIIQIERIETIKKVNRIKQNSTV